MNATDIFVGLFVLIITITTIIPLILYVRYYNLNYPNAVVPIGFTWLWVQWGDFTIIGKVLGVIAYIVSLPAAILEAIMMAFVVLFSKEFWHDIIWK